MGYDINGPSSMYPQSLQQPLMQPSCYTDQLIEPSCAFLTSSSWQQVPLEPRVRRQPARQLEIFEAAEGKVMEIAADNITIQYRNEVTVRLPVETCRMWKNMIKPGDVVGILRVGEDDFRLRIVSGGERQIGR